MACSARQPRSTARRPLALDLALPARDVDYALLRELAALEPTGPGNAAPVVGVHGLTVTRIRAAAGGHAQLTLRREVDVLDGIAFGRGDLVGTVREGDRVDVAARLASRRFGGLRVDPAGRDRRRTRAGRGRGAGDPDARGAAAAAGA